ncbi:MAG TPA: sigma factor-like helix-turn-helix DNA-binding protein [Dehalococcoidia bacterium]|nr:sigma factor-like helix-turn-helix DNA-binding protein [Dehalococcoidia bacterium]
MEHHYEEPPMSLEKIGQICPRASRVRRGRRQGNYEITKNGDIGVTRERVRQIEVKALRKLRHPIRTRILLESEVNKNEGDF